MTESNRHIKLGIVGCGAITEFAYLHAAAKVQELQVVALADKNLGRAERLAKQFGIDLYVDDYRRLPKDLDGVVIALPHDLHAPVAIEFLSQGTPVLVEKPLALKVDEARKVIDIARTNGTVLQVGQIYRFCNRARLVKRALEEGWLGRLRGFTLEGNFADTNPMASGFAWNKEHAGGGTLVDVGSLILDLLIWWLGDPVKVEYRDDSRGGVECECELSLELSNSQGPVAGNVTLSRLRKLKDIARIDGERFSIIYGFETKEGLLELLPASPRDQIPFVVDTYSVPPQSGPDFFSEQLKDFATAIRTGRPSAAPGESVLPSLSLIEECYRMRKPLGLPWETVSI